VTEAGIVTAVRILIADDHEVFRRGLRSLLELRSDWQVCGEAGTGLDVVRKARELKPDVVVLDISMPELSGLEATRTIRTELAHSEVVIVSQHDSPNMLRAALDAGAHCYVTKSQVSRDLLAAVEAAAKFIRAKDITSNLA
jgi:DNA-binding NarL/FixJ family response regulator